jgi:hypothetical protein
MAPAITSLTLYQAVMGQSFTQLAPALQRFHGLRGRHVLSGQVQIAVPASIGAKLLAVLLGTPLKPCQGAIRFELDAQPGQETWLRHFPGKTMRSTLQGAGPYVTERLGAATLSFQLTEQNGALNMQLVHMRFLGFACPKWLLPHIIARETGQPDQLHFEVQAVVPILGLVTRYTGFLTLPTPELT